MTDIDFLMLFISILVCLSIGIGTLIMVCRIDDCVGELPKEQQRGHGEWITIWDRNDPNTSSEGKCSVCGRVSKRPFGHYCKWCGSVMDKE